MNLESRIDAFVRLGSKIEALNRTELAEIAVQAKVQNPWFDQPNVERAFRGIAFMLKREKLSKWLANYTLQPEVPRIVGVIMAGNIPLVGFHDLLCVLLSGHLAAVKVSAKDTLLVTRVIEWLIQLEPTFKRSIQVCEKLDQIDAVICTGSDNTARYFDYYFGKYPNIIRKNRTSVAVLDGTETANELQSLGTDIFSYFGLGCRNVSKLYTPSGYDLRDIFPAWEGWEEVIHHNKYKNNYDYHKAILLVNKEAHLDTGFLLVRETEEIVAPTGLIYQQSYRERDQLRELLDKQEDKIQCIIGHGHIPFGKAQSPEPWEYADGVDTMDFLKDLF